MVMVVGFVGENYEIQYPTDPVTAVLRSFYVL